MSERKVIYAPGDSLRPRCNCPRVVNRPTRVPELVVGPDGDKTRLPALPADGTLTVWHRPECDEGAP